MCSMKWAATRCGKRRAVAARPLNMPLTTVSRHIGELESALGVRLLARTTRKLTLTDAGGDYVAAARRILEALWQQPFSISLSPRT